MALPMLTVFLHYPQCSSIPWWCSEISSHLPILLKQISFQSYSSHQHHCIHRHINIYNLCRNSVRLYHRICGAFWNFESSAFTNVFNKFLINMMSTDRYFLHFQCLSMTSEQQTTTNFLHEEWKYRIKQEISSRIAKYIRVKHIYCVSGWTFLSLVLCELRPCETRKCMMCKRKRFNICCQKYTV